MAISLLIGTAVGLVAGYFGGSSTLPSCGSSTWVLTMPSLLC